MRSAGVQMGRPDVTVYRFSTPVTILVPVLAIILQVFLPIRFSFVRVFDLPLLVVIFFAISRREQVAGLMTGAIIGLVQDSLTQLPIGIYGLANTIVGYGASSLSVKIDVDNPGSRFLITFGFYLLHQAVYYTVGHGMARLDLQWYWRHELLSALANSIMAVVLFAILDRFKQRV
jgi:rod shape-determining protein MreD